MWIFALTSLSLKGLSLAEAEELALSRSWDRKKKELQIRSVLHEGESIVHGFLPTVSLSYDKTWPLTPKPRESTSPYWTPGITLAFTPIKNPFLYGLEKDIQKEKETMAYMDFQDSKRNILSALRRDYFKTQILKKKETHLLDRLGLLTSSRRLSQERYNRGFAKKEDLERLDLSIEEEELTLVKHRRALTESTRDLGFDMGVGTVPPLTSDLDWNKIPDLLGQEFELSPSILKKKRAITAKDLELKKLAYNGWPTLSVSAQTRWLESAGPGSPIQNASTITAGLSWQIFDRLSHMDQEQKLRDAKEILRMELAQEEEIIQKKRVTLGLRLKDQYADLVQQKTMVERRGAFLQTTKKRFDSGLIPSDRLLEDSRDHLTQVGFLYDQELYLLETVIGLAGEVGFLFPLIRDH